MISKNKMGVVIGSAFGLWHFAWAVLVVFGVAQWLIDWAFRLHFIKPVYIVTAFQPAMAVGLIVVTSILGYVIGWIVAAIWNWLHAEPRPAARRVIRHAA